MINLGSEETLLRYLQYTWHVNHADLYNQAKPYAELQRLNLYWSKQVAVFQYFFYKKSRDNFYRADNIQGLNLAPILQPIEQNHVNLLAEPIYSNWLLRQHKDFISVYCEEHELKMRLLFKYICSDYIRVLLRPRSQTNRISSAIRLPSSDVEKISGKISPAA